MNRDMFSMNGYRIHVMSDWIGSYGAFYQTDDPGEIPAVVTDYYCSICARERNGESRDGEANCEHKSLLRFAVAVLNDRDDADYHRELQETYRAAANGTL